MAIIKCKMCGGDIILNEEKTFGTCEYCGSTMTLPKVSDDQRAARFNRGNHFRRQGDFDKALAVYESIVREDDTDAEAHWCCALCRFGIEYVEDPNTFEYIPTCHRASFDSFLEDVDYRAALEYSDGITRRQYQKDAAKIAEVQRGILATSQNEEPFDVFICYKETDDETHERTRDSLDAQEIYYQLTQIGYRVFFSRITLEDKAGTEYEPYIFAALNSARVMVTIGSKPEYFNAVWVKNEWSRFLAMMRRDRNKLLLPCYKNMDPYDLPEQLGVLQSYDMTKIGFMQDLIRGIQKVLQKDEPKQVKTKETVLVQERSASVEPLLRRALLFLEDRNFTSADEYCERVLDQQPDNALAYLGKLMAELKVQRQEVLPDCSNPLETSSNYQKAVRFGDEKLAAALKSYNNYIKERNENARLQGIYDRALSAMKTARDGSSYKNAAQLFKKIPGYKDSDTLAKQCMEQAKKAARKKKRLMVFASFVLFACVVLAVVFVTVIVPARKHNRAMELIAAGEYDAAYALLAEIGDTDTIESNKYDRAIEMVKVGEYDAAYLLLDEIGNSKSEETIASNKYERAVKLIDAGDFQAAISLLDGLNYSDSNEKIEEAELEIEKERFQNVQIGSSVFFGSYEQDNNTSNGGEDIEWLVLDKKDDRILIISKYALDCVPYNKTYSSSVTWETCTLRTWLNEVFINAAFSIGEQKLITDTTITADKNPTYNTTDKVFLLSAMEARDYFGSDRSIRCQATAYAKAQGVYTSLINGNCWSWLRSPGNKASQVVYVGSDGAIYDYGTNANRDSGAVRPALWINLE